MAQTESKLAEGHIGGVSLASFLQILEQERKNCTLKVVSRNVSGSFYFEEGDLIDAECGDVVGQDAVYIMLSIENPTFKVTGAEDRLHRISQPLAHLLLNAATRIDEEKHENGVVKMVSGPAGAANVQENPALKRVVETILGVSGIKHYYVLDRQGKMVTQSSKNQKIGDFITYCIMSGIQIRKCLDARGPHRIRLVMENDEVLLILPGAGMIIGLMIDKHASIQDITARLRPALTNK